MCFYILIHRFHALIDQQSIGLVIVNWQTKRFQINDNFPMSIMYIYYTRAMCKFDLFRRSPCIQVAAHIYTDIIHIFQFYAIWMGVFFSLFFCVSCVCIAFVASVNAMRASKYIWFWSIQIELYTSKNTYTLTRVCISTFFHIVIIVFTAAVAVTAVAWFIHSFICSYRDWWNFHTYTRIHSD